MTIHRRSYRPFQGDRRPAGRTFWVITRRELRLSFRKKWVKRLLVMAGIPLVALMFGLYVQLVVEKAFDTRFTTIELIEELYQIEIFFLVLMMAALGADIIAKDVAAQAHTLYFCRPLTPGQYLWGKVLGVAGVLFLLLAAPGLLLSVAQLLLAQHQDWGHFARLVVGILAYSALLAVCAAILIACLSSFGRRSRFVGAAWVGLYFFSAAAHGGLLEVAKGADWVRVVSIHNLFLDTGRFFFAERSPGITAPLVLLVLSSAALGLLYLRLNKLERSEQ